MSNFIPNSFQVPNAFVDEVLNKISDAACKIYLIINRKTRGWTKEMDSISLSQLELLSGKSRPTVIRAKNELIQYGLIVELPSTMFGNTYKLGDETSINFIVKFPSKNILLSKNIHSASKDFLPLLVKKFNHASKNILPLLVKNFYTHKTTIKNNYQSNKKINKKSLTQNPVSEKPNAVKKTKNTMTELPENFAVSERVLEWANKNNFNRLDEHLENFIGYAKANAKRYADWDQALMNAIRGNWARLQGHANPKPQNQNQPYQRRFGGNSQQSQGMRDVTGEQA